MTPFRYTQLAADMVFGPGSIGQVGDVCQRLGMTRILLIYDQMTADAADTVADQLDQRLALRWSDVAQHVPVELAERAREAASTASIDGIVCVGGGSTIGLAKAVALTHGVPIVAIPTTYAGSEQTTIYGLTGGQHKQTGKDPSVLPRAVIYDPLLTLGLPPAVTGPSAFNALAHSIEALWVNGSNPITTAIALQAIKSIRISLPAVMANPADVDQRGELQVGAALSGMALGATAAGLHHKICHVLGGRFGLTHADAHSVILPHVVDFNISELPDQRSGLSAALDVPVGHEAAGLWDLAVASQVPTTLAELAGTGGPLQRNDLAPVADLVAAEVTDNPRPVHSADVLGILNRAYDGRRPNDPDPSAFKTTPGGTS